MQKLRMLLLMVQTNEVEIIKWEQLPWYMKVTIVYVLFNVGLFVLGMFFLVYPN